MTKLDKLNDISALIAALPTIDDTAHDAATAHQTQLTKPPGSLGRLEEVAEFVAGWHAVARREINQARAIIFAGNHGVCAQGVNAFPQSVTAQMVANFEAGGAAINQLCKSVGADLSVVPLELDHPTKDFTQAPALTETELLSALNRGMAAVQSDTDILILGEMGIGNSTVAAALCAALYGGSSSDWVGPGTGADADGIARKVTAINAGLSRHHAALGSPLAILQAFGGYEQAAICGAILAARMNRTPVILDGFICTAAAAVLHATDETTLDHCLVGHQSHEPGHRKLLDHLGKRPLLNLDMRLGEGTGAALALSVIRGALACHNGMATFAEAGVSDAGASNS